MLTKNYEVKLIDLETMFYIDEIKNITIDFDINFLISYEEMNRFLYLQMINIIYKLLLYNLKINYKFSIY
jgi:hypothetical protein